VHDQVQADGTAQQTQRDFAGAKILRAADNS